MTIQIKKGSTIILQDESKIVKGSKIKRGDLQFFSSVLASAVAGPILAYVLNKIVDAINDKIKVQNLNYTVNVPVIPAH